MSVLHCDKPPTDTYSALFSIEADTGTATDKTRLDQVDSKKNWIKAKNRKEAQLNQYWHRPTCLCRCHDSNLN